MLLLNDTAMQPKAIRAEPFAFALAKAQKGPNSAQLVKKSWTMELLTSEPSAPGRGSLSLKTLSTTDTSVAVVSDPQKAVQSLTAMPAETTSLPLLTVPATMGTCSSVDSSSRSSTDVCGWTCTHAHEKHRGCRSRSVSEFSPARGDKKRLCWLRGLRVLLCWWRCSSSQPGCSPRSFAWTPRHREHLRWLLQFPVPEKISKVRDGRSHTHMAWADLRVCLGIPRNTQVLC